MQEFQINVSEETESSSDNPQKTIFNTLAALYEIEALFHGISLISDPLSEADRPTIERLYVQFTR